MKAFKTLITTGLLMAVAIGCSTTRSTEHMLSAAGFKRVPANTPQRQADLASLPADKLTPVQRDGKQYYVFPDPTRNALWVGQNAQYQEYQALRLQQQMLDEQAATMNGNYMTTTEFAPEQTSGWW